MPTFASLPPELVLPLIYYKTLRAHSISMSMSHLTPSTPLSLSSPLPMYYPHFLSSCNMTRDSEDRRVHMSSRTWYAGTPERFPFFSVPDIRAHMDL